jgi:hypothetical protein
VSCIYNVFDLVAMFCHTKHLCSRLRGEIDILLWFECQVSMTSVSVGLLLVLLMIISSFIMNFGH